MIVANVNILAVVVAALVSMAIGFFWYGPLFGKTWMREMKIKMPSPDKMPNMTKEYTTATIGAIVTAFVLGYFISMMGVSGWMLGARVGAIAAIGFLATAALSSVIWEGKTWKLYMLNVGYHVINFVIVGAILGAWM